MLEEDEKEETRLGTVELDATIENMFENKPDGRKKKDLKAWKETINSFIERRNSKGTKAYNLQK